MLRVHKVATVQFEPTMFDKAGNIARLVELCEAAAKAGARFIVTPEMGTTGYCWFDREEVAPFVETVPGPATDRLCQLAAQLDLHLVVGLAERDGDAFYNGACLIGPEGLMARYRKIHLAETDRAWATAGDIWTVADTPLGRIGLMIGHDAAFPEAGRILALRGCDIVACPAAIKGGFSTPHAGTTVPQSAPIPTGADPHHWHHYRVRAGENNVFLAFANVFDPANGYPGLSGVFGPDTFEFPRREAVAGDGEGTATAMADTTNLDSAYPTNVMRRKDLMLMRLPHHYRDLIRSERNG